MMNIKKLFLKYWWIFFAVLAIAGMFTSILSIINFSRNANIAFLLFSVLAAVGWFTREKKPQNLNPLTDPPLSQNQDEAQ